MFFEDAGEVLRIVETEEAGGIGDAGAREQQLLCALHDEASNVVGGGVARQFVNEVAKVVGRKEEFAGTVADGG